eukprot:1102033-Amphidinium_carterae.1
MDLSVQARVQDAGISSGGESAKPQPEIPGVASVHIIQKVSKCNDFDWNCDDTSLETKDCTDIEEGMPAIKSDILALCQRCLPLNQTFCLMPVASTCLRGILKREAPSA